MWKFITSSIIGFLFAVFILFTSTLFCQTSGNEGWFWQYPKPQGNTLRDIFIFDSTTAIAVGDLGTVIKTYDGGKNWDVKNHVQGTEYLSNIFFLNKNKGWMCGGKIILSTEDGGKNWNLFYTDSLYNYSSVYFINNHTGWIFGYDIVDDFGFCLKTTDAGITWAGQGLGYDFMPRKAFFISANTGWVFGGGFAGSYFFETTDGGATWIQQNVKPDVWELRDVCFIDDNNWFFVGGFGIFAKTTNRGVTWEIQDLSEKYQKEYYQSFYSVFFNDSLTGWIVGGDNFGYILRTSDGGKNWEEIKLDGNTGQLYKIRFADKNNGWVVGSSGMIYRTIKAGENWISQREKQYYFRSIYFTDENTGWAVGDSGVIMHTEDGGNNWIKQHQNDSLSFNSIYAIDKQNVIVIGGVIRDISTYKNAIILNSIDGGKTWYKNAIDSILVLKSVYFNNNKIGWTVGNNSLLKTTDGGLSWYPKNSEMVKLSYLDKVQFVDDQIGWIIDNSDSTILKTIDGGKTWTKHKTGTGMWLQSLFFINENVGWTVGNYQGDNNIHKTIDGGESWVPQNAIYADISSLFFINNNIGWVCGFDYLLRVSVIYKTTDSGNSWYKQECPIKNEWSLSELFFTNASTGWAVGAGIIKTTNGGGTVSVKGHKELNQNILEKMELYQNYPNPLNPSTVIEYKLIKKERVLLQIFNILGQKVETLIDEEQSAGNHKISWKPKNISSGIYIYQLCTQTGVITKKMLILK